MVLDFGWEFVFFFTHNRGGAHCEGQVIERGAPKDNAGEYIKRDGILFNQVNKPVYNLLQVTHCHKNKICKKIEAS